MPGAGLSSSVSLSLHLIPFTIAYVLRVHRSTGNCRADVVTDLDEETQEEMAAGQSDDPSFFLRRDEEPTVVYARRIFERVFCSDIERVLKMDVRPFMGYPSVHTFNNMSAA